MGLEYFYPKNETNMICTKPLTTTNMICTLKPQV